MEGAPHIAKDPYFCDYVEEVLERDDIVIKHVLIPMRDFHAAAESRRYVQESAISQLSLLKRLKSKIRPSFVVGGLWHTKNKGEQENILLHQVYKLALALSNTTIPVTLLRYPRLVKDSSYLYRKLKPTLCGISYSQFHSVFEKTVRPEWIHNFNENDC